MIRSKSGWWFAWYPVRAGDTDKIVWLRRVYREHWAGNNYYYETENPF